MRTSTLHWLVLAACLAAACASAESRARSLLDQAREAREAGRLGEGAGLLVQLVSEFGETPAARDAAAFAETVRAEREARALEEVDRVRQGQEDFFGRQRRYAQSIEELLVEYMLIGAPDGPALGYRFRTRSSPAADGYTISAESVVDGETRSFFQDLEGVVRVARGEAASPDSPPLE